MSDRGDRFFEALRDLASDGSHPPIEAIREVWPSIAGETFAAHTWPVEWRDAVTLRLTADSAAWLSELARGRQQLLRRLNRRLPVEVDTIEVSDRPRPEVFRRPSDTPEHSEDDGTGDDRSHDELRDRLDADDNDVLDDLPEDLRQSILNSHPSYRES